MKRILLVDDEDASLRELQRALDPLRDRWEVSSAHSAREALAILAEHAIDVIAADVGMPDVSGADLLTQVRQDHPEVVRMMLVAEADRLTARRAMGEAHQVVPKPCSKLVLASSVARACALHSLLSDDRLVRLVSKLDNLPSVPGLYFEMLEEMKNPASTVESVGQIIAKDLAMTAKVLQMVNSAFFGLSQDIVDPGQAATFLGLDTLKSLVLSLHTFSQFDGVSLKSFSITDVWEHSMRVANFARAIMETERPQKRLVEEAFLAGMMHDAGKLVLAAHAPDRFSAAGALAERDGAERHELERRVFGASHAGVGAYLLGLWGLPASVVEAVAFHHGPSKWPVSGFSPLCAVHAANALSRVDLEHPPEAHVAGLEEGFLERLALAGRLPVWIEACRKALGEVSA